jgi:hypothetical protein
MSVIASAPGLALQLLERAELLGRGQALQARHLSWRREQVLDAMEELLRGGFALGSLLRSPSGQAIEDASLFGITDKGKSLAEQLSHTAAGDDRREA